LLPPGGWSRPPDQARLRPAWPGPRLAQSQDHRGRGQPDRRAHPPRRRGL